MKLFTNEEIRDLIISILILALIFSFPKLENFLENFFIALLIVFFSFLLHEIAHKLAAKKLGCMATYKIWPTGILIGIAGMLFFRATNLPLFIALPGFVEIMPYAFGRWGFKVVRLTPKDLGLIALAGVGINILLAVLFKPLPGEVFSELSWINGWIAMVNLLPIPPLDGSKIFLWKEWFWLFLIFITVLTLIL